MRTAVTRAGFSPGGVWDDFAWSSSRALVSASLAIMVFSGCNSRVSSTTRSDTVVPLGIPYPIADAEAEPPTPLHASELVFVFSKSADPRAVNEAITWPSVAVLGAVIDPSDASVRRRTLDRLRDLERDGWRSGVSDAAPAGDAALADNAALAVDATRLRELGFSPPAQSVWLLGPEGMCHARVTQPYLARDPARPQQIVIAYGLEGCWGQPWAQLGIVAPHQSDLRWHAAQERVVEVGVGGSPVAEAGAAWGLADAWLREYESTRPDAVAFTVVTGDTPLEWPASEPPTTVAPEQPAETAAHGETAGASVHPPTSALATRDGEDARRRDADDGGAVIVSTRLVPDLTPSPAAFMAAAYPPDDSVWCPELEPTTLVLLDEVAPIELPPIASPFVLQGAIGRNGIPLAIVVREGELLHVALADEEGGWSWRSVPTGTSLARHEAAAADPLDLGCTPGDAG